MKRHPSLIPFSHEHKHALFICQLMKKNSPVYKDYPSDVEGKIKFISSRFIQLIFPHFEDEENILFTLIKGYDQKIDFLIASLKMEHIEIRKKLHKLAESESRVSHMDELGHLLESHIRKEERVLFESIQKQIPEAVLKDLQFKIQHRHVD